MGSRKLMTISLPPELLEKAQEVASHENRTKSELVREAIRFCELRGKASRERLFEVINEIQVRTRGVPPNRIRRLVREAVKSARHGA